MACIKFHFFVLYDGLFRDASASKPDWPQGRHNIGLILDVLALALSVWP